MRFPVLFRSRFARYGLGVAVMLGALLLRWAVIPVIGSGTIYITLFPAMMAVGVTFGVGPGLVGNALGIIVVEYFFVEQSGHGPLTLSLAVRSGIMLLTTLYVGRVGDKLRAARRRAEEEASTARASEQALRQQVELIDPARAEIIVREMQRVVRERGVERATPQQTPQTTGHTPTIGGVAVAGVGVLVLVGWSLGLEALKSVVPGFATMKANTAVCFLLAGLALALRERRTLRLVCAGIVCAVAGLTLIEHVSGADLGLDQLLFRDRVDPHTLFPGRMVEASALGFLLSGTSLLLLGSQARGGRWLQQALAIAAGAFGIVGVLGYAYSVQELYRFAGYSSMALHTAASLLVLAGALLWAPVDGVATALRKPGPAAELARWLLPGAVLVPAFLGWLVGLGLRRGLYAEGMDLAVLALAMMLSLAGLVVWTANAVHRTDSARRETEAQLENQAALMDQAHDALIVREMGGAVLFWNRGAEALYGWTATEAVGQRPHALLRTDPDAVRQFDAALEHGRHWFGELIHTTRDGRRVTVEARQTAARAADGRLLVLESVRDVTERKRAEEQLAAEKDRLAVTLRSIGDAVIATDESGHVTLLNKVAEDLTGWRAEDAIGQPLSRVFHIVNEETRREVESPVQRVLREGVVVGLANHTALIAKDGTDRPIADSGAPVRDLQGRIIGVVLVFRDQTEERRAEESLERSREGLSRLADASSRVVRETDLHGMLQAVSEAALLLTDARIATCGHGDVVGRSMVGGSARVTGAPACPPGEMFVLERGGVHMDLVEGADSIRLTDAQLRAHPRLRGGPPDHVPMRGLLGVRMSRRDGRTNGLILVTDKAHGEFTDEDESLLRQLATIASLALQHVEARISLEASNRSKNEFLAVLSHELRNPLAPIRNSLYILDRAAPGSEQAGRAQAVIDRQVVHLTRLVDDLLDVTRISRGKIQLRRERLDLCDLLRRTIEDHRSEFARNGLHLHSTLPEKPLWIDADRIRISQVIGNLLHNSAKFTDAGGHVSVSIRANENLGHAVVQVRDTGVGIGPDVLHRVFEPFAQADTSLARSKGGLGLGLALVKGLVEMHGGTVTVESEGLGKGAEFLVRLPLDSTPVPEAAQPRRAVDVRPRRVLVIEDNVDAANSLREVLELSSHVLAVAYSGSEAIEKARAFRPEVVLCDIGLPGMDGYQVARTMRADPELRGAKLVALTGYAAPEDVAKSRDAGFDAHIAKPPKVEALQAVLASERSS